MMTKQQHINFWVSQAEDDWSAADALFKAKKYLQCLFFAHLVIEKLCKAIWIKHNQENVPPKTHNLIYILSTTPVKLTDEKSEFMLTLNRFQLEGRYPDYMTEMHEICNQDFTSLTLNSVNQLKIWLQEKLQ